MRYGNPGIGAKLQELKDKGCDRILLFPLYPQYSAATTGNGDGQSGGADDEDAVAANTALSTALL